MKKLLVLLAALMLAAVAIPAAFAEVELGISATPVPGGQSNQGGVDTITGFHVGYAWTILYGTVDSLAMPAQMISNMLGYWDDTQGIYVDGPYLPGFLNLVDVGVRFRINPFIAYAELGTNNIYVYKGVGGQNTWGANLRLG